MYFRNTAFYANARKRTRTFGKMVASVWGLEAGVLKTTFTIDVPFFKASANASLTIPEQFVTRLTLAEALKNGTSPTFIIDVAFFKAPANASASIPEQFVTRLEECRRRACLNTEARPQAALRQLLSRGQLFLWR